MGNANPIATALFIAVSICWFWSSLDNSLLSIVVDGWGWAACLIGSTALSEYPYPVASSVTQRLLWHNVSGIKYQYWFKPDYRDVEVSICSCVPAIMHSQVGSSCSLSPKQRRVQHYYYIPFCQDAYCQKFTIFRFAINLQNRPLQFRPWMVPSAILTTKQLPSLPPTARPKAHIVRILLRR